MRRVLDEPWFRAAAGRVQAEMAAHDAGVESADLLEQLTQTRPDDPQIQRRTLLR